MAAMLAWLMRSSKHRTSIRSTGNVNLTRFCDHTIAKFRCKTSAMLAHFLVLEPLQNQNYSDGAPIVRTLIIRALTLEHLTPSGVKIQTKKHGDYTVPSRPNALVRPGFV
jgi:hypothetical protein